MSYVRLFGFGGDRFPLDNRAQFLAQLALGYLMSRDIDPVLQFNLFQYHKSIGFLDSGPRRPRASIWSVSSRKPRALVEPGMASRLAAQSAHACCCSALCHSHLRIGPSRRRLLCRSPVTSSILSSRARTTVAISDQAEAFWTKVHATLAYLAQLSSFFMWQRRCSNISSAKIQPLRRM